jgi:hypothetical protein
MTGVFDSDVLKKPSVVAHDVVASCFDLLVVHDPGVGFEVAETSSLFEVE